MITIVRAYHKDSTTGILTANWLGQKVDLFCIELPWKNNQRRVSCIPEGNYRCFSHTSPKFGRTFHIRDVPGRSEILIHVANKPSELLGCIAPGMTASGNTAVNNSRNAMNKLINLLWPKDFDIVITSQSGPPASL